LLRDIQAAGGYTSCWGEIKVVGLLGLLRDIQAAGVYTSCWGEIKVVGL
jgi:hypothetical protein